MIWLFTIFVKILSAFVVLLPRKVQLFLGDILGLTWFYLVPIRRKTVLENLALAFPALTKADRFRLAGRNYRHYGRSFIEFLMLPQLNQTLFERIFDVEGFYHYQVASREGKGVFLLTLHVGNWEMMSATCGFLKIPLHVITKKFKARSLNQIWTHLRLDRGIKLIREEKSTFDILRALRQGGAVGFILDQFMGPPVGVRTSFFGHETGTAAALALFADRTRAPVVPVYNIRQPNGRLKIIFEPPVTFMEQGSTDKNISFMTQKYTSKIEQIVKAYPEQWLWLHRRWKPFRE